MHKLFFVSLFLSPFVLVACGDDTTSPDGQDAKPVEEGWIKMAEEVTFPQDGETAITELIVGSQNDALTNYHNRGDVIVTYDGPPNAITVEMNRFTTAVSEDAAADSYERLIFWAYATTPTDTTSPSALEDAGVPSCAADTWADGCQIQVYYDGKDQDVRSGAHFRIQLPSTYAQTIEVATQDNIRDDDYKNTGDVKIKDLFGSAKVNVDSGTVDIKVADNAVVAPTCAKADYDACVANDWDKDTCKCYEHLGGVSIESSKENAANITVDVPKDFWATATISNEASATDLGCTAEVDCNTFDACGDDKYPEDDKRVNMTINKPDGENIIDGAGYNVSAGSKECENVDFVDSPDDVGNLQREVRGNILLCSGCADVG